MSRIPKRRSGKKEIGVKKKKGKREKHFWNKPVSFNRASGCALVSIKEGKIDGQSLN